MTGVLLIDKPAGPTSHDVVARIRRGSGERRIGHTGTLDPGATGLLPLVLGGATRLASLITSGDKTYEATIRFGVATDTDDAAGRPIGTPATVMPSDAEVDAALSAYRGTFDQRPPNHSAKKVQGERAYERARRAESVDLKPVTVTVHSLERTGRDGPLVFVRVVAGTGFYVRALARDLGDRLGCGAHLHALRRTRSGVFDVADALPLADAERLGPAIAARLLSPFDALAHLPSVRVTVAGLKRALHGNPLGPEHLAGRVVPAAPGTKIRIVNEAGTLVALAESRGSTLQPIFVL